jgi:hypothetical protein
MVSHRAWFSGKSLEENNWMPSPAECSLLLPGLILFAFAKTIPRGRHGFSDKMGKTGY